MNFKLYQKTCTRNKIQEIKEASDTNKLQRIYLIGGDEGDRTPDLNAASVALSQLSYVPGRVGGVPKGIRTPVAGVKGRCPRPTRRWGPLNKQIIMKES